MCGNTISCLSMHFNHRTFSSMQLQHIALQFTVELNRMTPNPVSHVLRVGYKGRGLKLARTILYARQRAVSQAQVLLKQVKRAMVAEVRVKALAGLEKSPLAV